MSPTLVLAHEFIAEARRLNAAARTFKPYGEELAGIARGHLKSAGRLRRMSAENAKFERLGARLLGVEEQEPK